MKAFKKQESYVNRIDNVGSLLCGRHAHERFNKIWIGHVETADVSEDLDMIVFAFALRRRDGTAKYDGNFVLLS